MELFGVNRVISSHTEKGRNLLVGSIDLIVTVTLGKCDHFAKSNLLTSVIKPFYRWKQQTKKETKHS